MANPTILAAGLDPTGFTSISGAQLKQLTSSAQFATGIGGIVVTTDIAGVPQFPDVATGATSFANFAWLRISPTTLSVSLYSWNPNAQYVLSYASGSVITNWTPSFTGAIPAGSITGTQIAPNTVQPGNINLTALITALGLTPSSYLTNASTPTGGSVSGSFGAGLTLNNASVTNSTIAQDGVNGIISANINPKVVAASRLLGGTINQILATTDNANTAAWVAGNTVGARILQQIVYYDTQTGVSDTVHSVVASMPTFANGTLYGTAGTPGGTTPVSSSGLIAPITPKNSASKLRIEICLYGTPAAADYFIAALFSDTTGAKFSGYSSGTSAISAAAIWVQTTNIQELHLVYELTSGQTTEIDFGIRFGSISHNTTINKDATTASFFGGSGAGLASWIKITEYI